MEGESIRTNGTLFLNAPILKTKNIATSPHTFMLCDTELTPILAAHSWTPKPQG